MTKTIEEQAKAKPYHIKDREDFVKRHQAHLDKWKWKPGESGNKTGRPRGSISLTEQLKVYLRRHPEAMSEIIHSLVKEGISGNIIAIKETFDRVDGKVAETHNIKGDLPVVLNFMPAEVLIRQGDQPALPSSDDIEGEIVER